MGLEEEFPTALELLGATPETSFYLEGGWNYGDELSTFGSKKIEDVSVLTSSSNDKTNVLVHPVKADAGPEVLKTVTSVLHDEDNVVFLLTSVHPKGVHFQEFSSVSRRHLLMADVKGSRRTQTPTPTPQPTCGKFEMKNANGVCVEYIYGSPGLLAGLIFGLFWLSLLCLGFCCMADVQTPSQFWLHDDLPLKGKLDE